MTFKAKYLVKTDGAVSAFGTTFEGGKAAEVEDRYLSKVEGNKFFEVVGNAKESKDKEPVQTQEPNTGEGTGLTADDKGLHAVHKGRGVYAIMRDGTEVQAGISKEDAEAFNALSEDEQREYLGKN